MAGLRVVTQPLQALREGTILPYPSLYNLGWPHRHNALNCNPLVSQSLVSQSLVSQSLVSLGCPTHDHHRQQWIDTYREHLHNLYRIVKRSKVDGRKEITLVDFIDFAYQTSSKAIF